MNAITPASGCTVGRMAFEEALHRVLGLVTAPLPSHMMDAASCAGHVLAGPVTARLDLPGFDQSAMDGYALRAEQAATEAWLPIIGRAAAGDAPARLAAPGAIRIFTGAPVPAGADTVVVQESTRRCGDAVAIGALPPPGSNIRRRGEDVQAGDILIQAGTVLDWRHLTMLAAQGVRSVPVRRAPRVAILSTGRELSTAEKLAPGLIHDSNRPMLEGLAAAWGAEIQAASVLPDDPAAIQSAIAQNAVSADLVLTSGGISVGEEDHVRTAFRRAGGRVTVLTVAMKPGKPLAVGRLGDALFLGLPGNPQAALAGAAGFLRPLLARLRGTKLPALRAARARFSLGHRPGSVGFVPVRLHTLGASLWADRAGPGGSGRLRPLLAADGLAFVDAQRGDVAHADLIPIIPLPVGAG